MHKVHVIIPMKPELAHTSEEWDKIGRRVGCDFEGTRQHYSSTNVTADITCGNCKRTKRFAELKGAGF